MVVEIYLDRDPQQLAFPRDEETPSQIINKNRDGPHELDPRNCTWINLICDPNLHCMGIHPAYMQDGKLLLSNTRERERQIYINYEIQMVEAASFQISLL